MTNAADIQHAARWAARIARDRAQRVTRKFGAEQAPAILAEAARIEAEAASPVVISAEEAARLAAELEEWRHRHAEREAFNQALLADLARRNAEAAALRRRVLTSLRRLGFRRQTATSGKSAYYHHLAADVTVRVSDHEVPLTAARESEMAHGGHSWALTDLGLVIDANTTSREAGEWLVAIRRKIGSQP